LYMTGNGVLKREWYGWKQIQIPNYWATSLCGVNDNSLFVVGISLENISSRLYHYNGNDWYEFLSLRLGGFVFTDVWAFEDEAFVVGSSLYTPATSAVIIHGK
jgi:hypothetical protein